MALYNTADQNYFYDVVEQQYCTDHNLIVDRYIVPIRTGIYMYELPDYVLNIRRFTYRGRQLDAFSGAEQIQSGSTPYNYSQGEPRQYIYNYLGQRVIRLFPTPAEDRVPVEGADPWSGSIIRDYCIIEFFRTQDNNDEFKRIPAWFRDIVIKDAVTLKVASMDNQGFDKKTQMRYEFKAKRAEENLLRIKKKLFACMPKGMEPDPGWLQRNRPLRATLPWNFGRIVD